MKTSSFTAIPLILSLACADAATVMETREPSGDVSVMTVQGTQARLQGSPDSYILIDLERRKLYAVNLAKEAVEIDLPARIAPSPSASHSESAVNLRDQGHGPTIAGYPTRHYQVMSGSQLCSDMFLSAAALKAGAMESFMESFRAFFLHHRASTPNRDLDSSPCDDAHNAAWERYPELGVPLRVVSADSKLRQEVVSFRTQVPVTPGYFSVPDSLPTLSLVEYLRRHTQASASTPTDKRQ